MSKSIEKRINPDINYDFSQPLTGTEGFKYHEKYESIRRIVSAACLSQVDGRMLVGARHFDRAMLAQAQASGGFSGGKWKQGFIDQWCNYIDRKEAYIIAERQDQIRDNTIGVGVLYSEHLY